MVINRWITFSPPPPTPKRSHTQTHIHTCMHTHTLTHTHTRVHRLQLTGHNTSVLRRRFKALADKKKLVTDEDIIALVSDELHQPMMIWELLDLQVGSWLGV